MQDLCHATRYIRTGPNSTLFVCCCFDFYVYVFCCIVFLVVLFLLIFFTEKKRNLIAFDNIT